MMITAEISMYPFREDFRSVIRDFVAQLNRCEDLRITTGPTSTVIIGEYSRVMHSITEMMQWSYDQQGQAVFVTKFLPGYAPGQP